MFKKLISTAYLMFVAFALTALVGGPAFAADKWDGGDFRLNKGGKLQRGAVIFLGDRPGVPAQQGIPAMSATNNTISIGDSVTFAAVSVLAGVTGYAYVPVTKVATANAAIYGIALSATSAIGSKTLIAREGIVLATVDAATTMGDLICQSGTAGKLTVCSAAAGGIMLSTSQTSVVGVAMETKTGLGSKLILLNR